MFCAHGDRHGQQHLHAHDPESAAVPRYRFSPHSILTAHIARKLCDNARRGMHTSITKVKAHTGLTSNEMADTLAYEARQPAACNAMVLVSNSAFQDVFWPCARASAKEPQRTMSNLCDAIKQKSCIYPEAAHLAACTWASGRMSCLSCTLPALGSESRAPSHRLP